MSIPMVNRLLSDKKNVPFLIELQTLPLYRLVVRTGTKLYVAENNAISIKLVPILRVFR